MRTWMLIPLTLLPVAGVSILVARFYVDIPFSDQWQAAVPLLDKLYRDQLTWADWISQHNEHRPLFARLIWLPLARLTHWNTGYEVAVTLLLGVATLAILLWQAGQTARQLGQASVTMVWPAIAWLFFSMSQYETWLQSYLLHWMLHVFAVVAGLTLMARVPLKPAHIVLAAGLGVVGTFTVAGGVLFWPIGFWLLWWNPPIWRSQQSRRSQIAWMAVWLVITLLVAFAYLKDFHLPETQSTPGTSSATRIVPDLSWLAGFGLYLLSWLGAPVLIYTGSFVFGLLGLVALVWVLRRLRSRDSALQSTLLPYLAYGAFALANGLLISAARAGLSWHQALSPRYIIISALFWVALVMFLQIDLWRHGHAQAPARGQRLARGLIAGITCMAVVSWAGGAYMGLKHRAGPMQAAQQALCAGQDSDAVLLLIHSNPALVRSLLPVLKAHGLSLYRCQPDSTYLPRIITNSHESDLHESEGWIRGDRSDL